MTETIALGFDGQRKGPDLSGYVLEVPGPVSPETVAAWKAALAEPRDWPLVLMDGARLRHIADSTPHGILTETIRDSVDWPTRILSLLAFVVSCAALMAVLR